MKQPLVQWDPSNLEKGNTILALSVMEAFLALICLIEQSICIIIGYNRDMVTRRYGFNFNRDRGQSREMNRSRRPFAVPQDDCLLRRDCST